MLEGTPNQRNGFFIEAGAYDGVKFSNSLLFEMRYEKLVQVSRVIFSCILPWNRHDWSGLLVEPNPDAFRSLSEKQRKAWLLPQCFSTKTTPEQAILPLGMSRRGLPSPLRCICRLPA